MRIVSGLYGGRKIQAPKGRMVRPTTDKVRGAVFNMLQSRGLVDDVVVLDAFCGTGGMGLEALSRGAHSCTFVDSARDSLVCVKENISSLGAEDRAKVIASDVLKLRECTDHSEQTSLAFLDPPYEKGLIFPALERLSGGGWFAEGAYVVCETEKKYNGVFPAPFSVKDDRVYGEVRVFLLQFMTPV